MRFDVLTLFPDVFPPYLTASILGKGRNRSLIDVHVHDIRQHAIDKHRTTDDTPYGGGAGMIMMVEPIDRALAALAASQPREKQHVVVLSAKGRQFTQRDAELFAQSSTSLTLICGRYEGVDQRVADFLADEELSIGPYVLAGGELAALVVVEAVARLIPGVLGNPASLAEESFSETGPLVEYPHYTKPEVYKGWAVPPVLLSGNHAAIAAWRAAQQTPKE